jgi:hypothetical protein
LKKQSNFDCKYDETSHAISLNDVLFVAFVFLIYWGQSSAFQQILAIGGYYNQSFVNYLTLVTFVVGAVWLILEPNTVIKPFELILAIIMLVVAGISVRNAPNALGSLSGFTSIISRFEPFIIVQIIFIFKLKRECLYSYIATKMYMGFVLFESIIGITQFITRSTIFPTSVQGNSLVSSIYYVLGNQGGGTGDISVAQSGAYLVRASGLSGSGLYLGISILCALALSESFKRKTSRRLYQLVLVIAGAMTVTFTVWIGLAVFAFLKILYRRTKILPRWMLPVSVVIAVAWPVLGVVVSNYLSSFRTLLSRSTGLSYFLSGMNKNLSSLMFGQNFITKLVYETTNNAMRLTVDNMLFNWILNIGVVGTLICARILKKLIPNRAATKADLQSGGFYCLLITLMLLSNVNDFTRVLGVPLLILAVRKSTSTTTKMEELS